MNKFKITIDDQSFDVTVKVTDHNKANVEVNGISYDVAYEKKSAATVPVAKKAAIPSAAHMQTPNPQGTTVWLQSRQHPENKPLLHLCREQFHRLT